MALVYEVCLQSLIVAIIDACDLINSGERFTDLFGYAERRMFVPNAFSLCSQEQVFNYHYLIFLILKNPKLGHCRTTGVDVSSLSRSRACSAIRKILL